MYNRQISRAGAPFAPATARRAAIHPTTNVEAGAGPRERPAACADHAPALRTLREFHNLHASRAALFPAHCWPVDGVVACGQRIFTTTLMASSIRSRAYLIAVGSSPSGKVCVWISVASKRFCCISAAARWVALLPSPRMPNT